MNQALGVLLERFPGPPTEDTRKVAGQIPLFLSEPGAGATTDLLKKSVYPSIPGAPLS